MTELREKINQFVTRSARIEEEIDGIKGDLERILRFEKDKIIVGTSHYIEQAHKLVCTAEAALEEARTWVNDIH